MMFSTHCVQVLSNVNILWIVLDSALAMICAQTSDTWELCDCALFNYIEYFCLKKIHVWTNSSGSGRGIFG